MKTNELKLMPLDIETYKELVLIGGYIRNQDKWVLFEISYRKNELDACVKFLLEESIDYYCTFNGVLFDGQVIQYILDNHEKWYDRSGLEICSIVYEFVQQLINDQNYEIQPPYKEQYMDIKQIDMFLILHMNNQNRRTSLKWCEFSMNEDIEELPIHHGKENLTSEEIDQVISYWRNDIRATDKLLDYCIGNTDHKDYQGKDKIQLRLDLIEEMKMPAVAINWNDVKIGAELNKKAYLELTKMTSQQLWDKIKKRKVKTGFTFGDCYPDYWNFTTKEFKEFFTAIAKTKVNLNVKQEFQLIYNGTEYTMAKGGGHTNEQGRVLRADDEHMIYDCDIASMYPNAIAKRKLYPAHLGPKWNEAYISNIQKRIEAKKLYKETKDKKYDSFQETYKLVLNGNFGRLIDKHDWQYDPFTGMQVTIGSQIDIFMLVEALEVAGIHVVSLNTDGVVVYMKRNQLDTYNQVCQEWERKVGNDIMGKLEYTEYELLVQTSVNDYIAIKKGTEPIEDRVKKKGSFLTSYELHKNKSNCVVAKALEAWFIDRVPPEEFIKNHKSIWDFCIAKKASRDYHYRSVNRQTGEQVEHNKLIRYMCVTKGYGDKIYKIKNENSEKTGPKQSQVESNSMYQLLYNKPFKVENWEQWNLDYEYYISATYNIIGKIEPEIMRERKIKQSGKLELF